MQSKASFCTTICKELPSWCSKFSVIWSDAVQASVSCSNVKRVYERIDIGLIQITLSFVLITVTMHITKLLFYRKLNKASYEFSPLLNRLEIIVEDIQSMKPE